VALARKATELPETRGALCDGEISRAHLQAIADAYTPERTERLAPLETEFVEAPRTCARSGGDRDVGAEERGEGDQPDRGGCEDRDDSADCI